MSNKSRRRKLNFDFNRGDPVCEESSKSADSVRNSLGSSRIVHSDQSVVKTCFDSWIVQHPRESDLDFKTASSYRELLDSYQGLPEFAKTPATFAAVTRLGLEHDLLTCLQQTSMTSESARKELLKNVLSDVPGMHRLKQLFVPQLAATQWQLSLGHVNSSLKFPPEIALVLRQWENDFLSDSDGQQSLREQRYKTMMELAPSGSVAESTAHVKRRFQRSMCYTIARDVITYCRSHGIHTPQTRRAVFETIRNEAIDLPFSSACYSDPTTALKP